MITGEYEESKNFEIFRRYARLKGMIKRTVMYTKLEVLPDVTHALGTGSLVLMTAASIRKPLGKLYNKLTSTTLSASVRLLRVMVISHSVSQ